LTPYSFDFVADSVIKGRIYPALARHQARPYTQSWREFGQHWPWTTPLRIQEYCQQHAVAVNIWDCRNRPDHPVWYPICLGFFDFSIDYLSLVPEPVTVGVHEGWLRLLFWYHEGDNPQRISQRLRELCKQHAWPEQSWVFVSANTAARRLDNFVYFADFEFWYYQRNLEVAPVPVDPGSRTRDFTVLNRVHKPWRAAVMADLQRHGLLDHSYWSYCSGPGADDQDGPISVDSISQLRYARTRFLQSAPYFCDDLADQDRNNHAVTIPEHHSNSWCNIVIESQMDVDQSGGVFLTEKTFKPIKHGQPFFVVGAAGSLAELRNMGYRTFDHVLDNSYDLEPNATERWRMLLDSIQRAHRAGLPDIYQDCQADLRHNQQLFMSCHQSRLNTLLETINAHR
jgi:hypothetical protein